MSQTQSLSVHNITSPISSYFILRDPVQFSQPSFYLCPVPTKRRSLRHTFIYSVTHIITFSYCSPCEPHVRLSNFSFLYIGSSNLQSGESFFFRGTCFSWCWPVLTDPFPCLAAFHYCRCLQSLVLPLLFLSSNSLYYSLSPHTLDSFPCIFCCDSQDETLLFTQYTHLLSPPVPHSFTVFSLPPSSLIPYFFAFPSCTRATFHTHSIYFP